MTTDPTSAAITNAPATAATSIGSKPNPLGQDAFMKLLITQLQHQDPTAPQDDTQFIAQLAQFTSLERLTNIDTSLTTLVSLLQRAPAPAAGATQAVVPPA